MSAGEWKEVFDLWPAGSTDAPCLSLFAGEGGSFEGGIRTTSEGFMPARQPRICRRSPGFTLVEACIVLAIIGIMGGLAITGLTSVKQRDALSVAPRQLMAALETAKNQALATGREVIVVIIGNGGIADAPRCAPGDATRGHCVRYFVLEDLVGTGSTRFDDTALSAFDPADPESLGDRLLEQELLPAGIYIGRHPGYAPPTLDPRSPVHAGLPMDSDCSFCATGSPPRGFVRFAPDGIVQLGSPPSSGTAAIGGTIFLNVSAAGSPHPDTRMISILQPSGFISDRVGRSLH